MPFERYLQPEEIHEQDSLPDEYYNRYHHRYPPPFDSDTFSSNVQFQMPHLILGPTLAPGGGAEVLPAGMIASSASPWFGFPRSSEFSTNAPYVSPKPLTPSAPYPYSMPSIPSPLGLPVYSASGFDLLSVLSRVATRSHPKIVLGPVDMTCSFVVTDKRRFDNPIVYASPSFCNLTGYSEHEVIGSNCRFLQAPHGQVRKGDHRRYTAPDAVAHLRNSLKADKECQTSMINYRKGGAAFINLVTVIPIPGGVHNAPDEQDDVVFHVGFQVDLTEQPNAILQKLRDGTYIVNYSTNPNANPSLPHSTRDWRANSAVMSGASKHIRALLADPSFTSSLPLSTSTTSLSTSERGDPYDGNKLLNLILLESTPDFIHVLSLKGAFLYVAPSVHRVLGYTPQDLVGKSITDYCHPADVVPLMRELKESSISPDNPSSTANGGPKSVDLLYRMKTNGDRYLWVECRGRLHVEPGKGRKAIILSARVRSMPGLTWGVLARTSPSTPPPSVPPYHTDHHQDISEDEQDGKEFWALLSLTGTFLFVGAAIRHVLGYGAGEVIGRSLSDLITPPAMPDGGDNPRALIDEALALTLEGRYETRTVSCEMNRKERQNVDGSRALLASSAFVRIMLFHPTGSSPPIIPGSATLPQHPAHPIIAHIRLITPPTSIPTTSYPISHPSNTSSSSTPQNLDAPLIPPSTSTRHIPTADVFEELDVARGSSWQYELQQLKFANQRLLEEIEELENSLAPSAEVEHQPLQGPAEVQLQAAMPTYDTGGGIGGSGKNGGGRQWENPAHLHSGPAIPVSQPQARHSLLPLKRKWDASNLSDGVGPT